MIRYVLGRLGYVPSSQADVIREDYERRLDAIRKDRENDAGKITRLEDRVANLSQQELAQADVIEELTASVKAYKDRLHRQRHRHNKAVVGLVDLMKTDLVPQRISAGDDMYIVHNRRGSYTVVPWDKPSRSEHIRVADIGLSERQLELVLHYVHEDGRHAQTVFRQGSMMYRFVPFELKNSEGLTEYRQYLLFRSDHEALQGEEGATLGLQFRPQQLLDTLRKLLRRNNKVAVEIASAQDATDFAHNALHSLHPAVSAEDGPYTGKHINIEVAGDLAVAPEFLDGLRSLHHMRVPVDLQVQDDFRIPIERRLGVRLEDSLVTMLIDRPSAGSESASSAEVKDTSDEDRVAAAKAAMQARQGPSEEEILKQIRELEGGETGPSAT